MAKSTRSKVKRHFRAKKRTEGVYAAAEAARLNRLHQKLKALATRDADGDIPVEEVEEFTDERDTEVLHESGDAPEGTVREDAMDLDSGSGPSTSTTTRISTHGPRESRREQWRLSKGMTARPASKGMNRQGTVAARRKAGRSHRRR